MHSTLSSGPARVLQSGTVTSFMGHPIAIVVSLFDGEGYAIEFRFEAAGPEEGLGASADVQPWGTIITLRNFREVSGRGSGQPVLLGEEGGRLVFLHFRVWHTGKTVDPMIHYTLFSAEKDSVGWVEAAPGEPSR
ncbi:MAG: hypothetical protein EA397_08220 [Deltaproteobacteria bacterium]|nr:MAG: hypothetical protein EA397_08220 [Deltaproteobacteria bacterium]